MIKIGVASFDYDEHTMNEFSHLPEEEFVSICKGAFNNHALRVCDTSWILSPCHPRYTKDFDYANFEFVRRKGTYSAVWMTSYDATAAREHVSLRHLIQVWLCDYHPPSEVEALKDARELAARIVRDLVLVLKAWDPDDRYGRVDFSRADVEFTIITNVEIDPQAGEPSLIAIIKEKLKSSLAVGGVRNLQLGSALTIQEDLDAG